MEDGSDDEQVLYQTELVQLFSEEDEVSNSLYIHIKKN